MIAITNTIDIFIGKAYFETHFLHIYLHNIFFITGLILKLCNIFISFF